MQTTAYNSKPYRQKYYYELEISTGCWANFNVTYVHRYVKNNCTVTMHKC